MITLQRKELVKTVTLDANKSSMTGHFDVVPDSFSFLKGVAKSFDRVKWNKLHFFYKPAVGTVYGGLFSMGFDWDWSQGDTDRTTLSGYTPNSTNACWADTEKTPMVLPQNRLQARIWYTPQTGQWSDKGPGKLHYAASGTSSASPQTLGEIWVCYSLTMQGTSPT